jgi:hypothetical protein
MKTVLNYFLALPTAAKILALFLLGAVVIGLIALADFISSGVGAVAGPFLWLAYMAFFVFAALQDQRNVAEEIAARANKRGINYNEVITGLPTWMKAITFLALFLASIAGGGLVDKILSIEDHLGLEFTPGDIVRIALIVLFSSIIVIQGFRNPAKKK